MTIWTRINGWSYKTRDNQFMISHTGANRCWYSAKIDTEASAQWGWEICIEATKVYHTTMRESMNWVESYELPMARLITTKAVA